MHLLQAERWWLFSLCWTVARVRLMSTLPLFHLIFLSRERVVSMVAEGNQEFLAKSNWASVIFPSHCRLTFGMGAAFEPVHAVLLRSVIHLDLCISPREGWAWAPVSQVLLPPLSTTSEKCAEKCTGCMKVVTTQMRKQVVLPGLCPESNLQDDLNNKCIWITYSWQDACWWKSGDNHSEGCRRKSQTVWG